MFGGRYYINQQYVKDIILSICLLPCCFSRLVHSFTAAGMLAVQYFKFGEFSGIGHVGNGYIRKGINLAVAFFCVYSHNNALQFTTINSTWLV